MQECLDLSIEANCVHYTWIWITITYHLPYFASLLAYPLTVPGILNTICKICGKIMYVGVYVYLYTTQCKVHKDVSLHTINVILRLCSMTFVYPTAAYIFSQYTAQAYNLTKVMQFNLLYCIIIKFGPTARWRPMFPHFLTRWVWRLFGLALESWATNRVGVHGHSPVAFHISTFFHSLFTCHWISFEFLLYDRRICTHSIGPSLADCEFPFLGLWYPMLLSHMRRLLFSNFFPGRGALSHSLPDYRHTIYYA